MEGVGRAPDIRAGAADRQCSPVLARVPGHTHGSDIGGRPAEWQRRVGSHLRGRRERTDGDLIEYGRRRASGIVTGDGEPHED